jgi:hypothetical protein
MKNAPGLRRQATSLGIVNAEYSVIKNKHVEKTPERQETLQKYAITGRKSLQTITRPDPDIRQRNLSPMPCTAIPTHERRPNL